MTAKKKLDVTVDLTEFAAYVEGFKTARKNEQDWKAAKERFQEFLENKLREAGVKVGTVNGKEAVRVSEYEQDQFMKDKFRGEYPELVDQFTIKQPRKRFSTPDGK